MKEKLMIFLILAVSASQPALGEGQYTHERKYNAGERYSYALMTDEFHNGIPAFTSIAEATLTVVPNSKGLPADQVRWQSLTKNGKGVDKQKLQVPEYRMSLREGSSLIEPSLDLLLEDVDDLLLGPVTDLLTYFVAISPHSGVINVRKPGDTWKNPQSHIGRWDRKRVPRRGQDCTEVTFAMTSLTNEVVGYRTSFFAPAYKCFELEKPWMNAPVNPEVPNNFQQITRNGESRDVMWGHEWFIIDTWVERSSGKILRATMENELTLQMKLKCDSSLENCAHEMPMKIRRIERLQLK